MIRPLLPSCLLGLTILIAPTHLVRAQSGDTQPPAVRDLIKQAVRAGSDKRFEEAVGFLDKALRLKSDDRDALDFLALMAGFAADKSQDKQVKLAMFRKAASAYEQITRRSKPLSADELKLGQSLKVDSARIAVLEGKPEQALDALTRLVSEGNSQAVLIDMLPDFEPVRKLPSFSARMVEAYKSAAQGELTGFKSYPFQFDLKTVDGQAVKSADLMGDVALVDVWGTWCPPCREEVPHLVELANRYAGKGLKVVGINCNEEGSPAEVKQTINDFVKSFKIPYPCVVNKESDSIEAKITGFEGYPTLLVLDRTGKLRLSLTGYQAPAHLEAIIAILMAEPAH